MDFRTKLEELHLTTDEINRFSKALKDEKFREMLHEYAEEISNPENMKKYEEEITQLEQERGMNVQFVHPKPHHVLKSSINGMEKCFINICSNDLINSSTCKMGRGQEGRVGQHWSLPYSLAPGRSDKDAKGNKCTIYDVVFNPDTLYIAEKNSRFMKLVNSTAVQGVEDAFKVKLDKMNVKIPKIKYKGVPHPAVIRKPISGHPGKEKASSQEELFPIHYPDTPPNEKPKMAMASPPQDLMNPRKESSSVHLQPTKPHYTIKYRSVIDLQDYRCSTESAPSPRPNEIVITVDLPLIKSAGDIDLNVTERSLVLESQKLAYKLELQLSYSVDDDKGDAKFNKAKKQLTITLPVLPLAEPAVVHVQGRQNVCDEEERDEGECKDRVERVVCEAKEVASLDTDGQNNTELSDFTCNASCHRGIQLLDSERGLQVFDKVEDKTDCFEGHLEPSQSGKAVDALLTCEGTNTETSRLEENNTEESEDCSLSGPDFCSLKISPEHYTEVDSCSLREEGKNHSNAEFTAVSTVASVAVFEYGTYERQCLPTSAKTAAVSQNKPVGSYSEKEFHISNDPTRTSQQPISVVNVVPSKLNFTPYEDTIAVSFPEETGVLSEEQVMNSSPEQIGHALGHKDIKFSSLREDTELQLKDVDSVHSSGQNQTDFTIKTPAILQEKSPEDGSDIIMDHATSAAFSFQNSLWFELD